MQALLDTSTGRAYIESESPPPDFAPLDSSSSDAEIDARIRATGAALEHPRCTAAIGQVVDTYLRVYGVRGLRVADASVLPLSVGGHPQATLYALAEQTAELILQ
jgi:choline dehydrogenase-like flavoprotein